MIRSYILLPALLLFSCKPNLPRDVLEPEKMQAVFWDYIKVENYVKLYVATDSTKSPADSSALLLAALYKKHKVTREQFNKSLKYYSANEEEMRKLLDTISTRSNRQVDSVIKIY